MLSMRNGGIQITRENQSNATQDLQNKLITSVENIEKKTSPKSKLSYPNISCSETIISEKIFQS